MSNPENVARLIQLGYHACHALDPEEHAEFKRLYLEYQRSITEVAPPLEEPEPPPHPPPPPRDPPPIRMPSSDFDKLEIGKVMGIRASRRNLGPFFPYE